MLFTFGRFSGNVLRILTGWDDVNHRPWDVAILRSVTLDRAPDGRLYYVRCQSNVCTSGGTDMVLVCPD